MENTAAENFEQLPLAKAEIPVALEGQYRVYTDHKNFKLVQAISAVNAMEVSGLSQVFKIEREALYKNTLIKPNMAAAPATDAAAADPSSPPT